MLLGAEFLAMILVVVYVGAVAVLFLFVVMMLDVDFAELRAGFMKNAPLGAMVGLVVLAEIVMIVASQLWKPGAFKRPACSGAPIPAGVTNTQALGQVLYTKYVYFFQAAGLILLDGHDRRDRADAAATVKASSGRTSACRTRATRRPRWTWSRCRPAATPSPTRPLRKRRADDGCHCLSPSSSACFGVGYVLANDTQSGGFEEMIGLSNRRG